MDKSEIFDQLTGMLRDRFYGDVSEAVDAVAQVERRLIPFEEYAAQLHRESPLEQTGNFSAATEPVNIETPHADEAEKVSQARGLTRQNLEMKAKARDMVNEVFEDAA